MRVIARSTLRAYLESRTGDRDQSSFRNGLESWFAEVRQACWKNSDEVKRHYSRASIISADRVVFDILGNRYRLVADVDFEKGIVWSKWIGTHKEYNKIDVKKVDYGGN